MKQLLLFLMAVLVCAPASVQAGKKAKADQDTQTFRYEIECAGNAQAGSYLVRVWSYSKKAAIAEDQCRKNAVHGVVFKGFSGDKGCVSQRPLVKTPSAEAENQVYFSHFFEDGGEFQKYASIVAGTTETVKVGKEYKVGCVVNVRKDDLRRALEAAGIIQSMNTGF